MSRRRAEFAPGVTGGYILAFCLIVLLWFGVGILLLPIMLVLAILHALYGQSLTGLARSHHLWLARHHLWATMALLAVIALALVAVPLAIESGLAILNTLAQAPNPVATVVAALPALGLPQIITLGLLAFVGWVVVTLWLCLRLIVHWLRWVHGRKA